jgi:hypothetical protein
VVDELQDMSKVGFNTLILEIFISYQSENRVHMWSKSINWKVMNINKVIAEFEKLITACK